MALEESLQLLSRCVLRYVFHIQSLNLGIQNIIHIVSVTEKVIAYTGKAAKEKNSLPEIKIKTYLL
jgi:hypothetical protein